ncbi:hypothetical protein [Gluconobacter sp. Gdi]|uniref:hypothetical protein n=1 Tax=Gluconobacter sp. Gdi TaxID=2691888 RepID=UPI001923F6D1|nr:hypothetical protein [Gluconobacter sp. Gdi]
MVWLEASGRLGKMGCPASLLVSAGFASSSGLRLLNKETPLRIWKEQGLCLGRSTPDLLVQGLSGTASDKAYTVTPRTDNPRLRANVII